ncbi:hypothetical protein [Polaribacter glomeratus]|uniref:Uncharacterized protein n=1 Tax=Polaribacter glomeratus TaxID=102 RepID=A0A2S7WYP3_9FLAO|nr:hypothetical protein [Polaribacter glomeratus]PQJ82689.1 hypothetical protein BTO16_08920 [Polaribacter glomeratus]TXD63996.1 hypothetical protein ESX12_16685 [Polaribacter glomeratus]
MKSNLIEHIKFILIDAINDDIQGIYELNNSVKKYYPELETQNGTVFVCGKILSELIADNYVGVFKMTNPKFEKIESINNEIGQKIASDKTNWTEYQNEWIYGIESVNVKKSVELENVLYQKIKTLHNTV